MEASPSTPHSRCTNLCPHRSHTNTILPRTQDLNVHTPTPTRQYTVLSYLYRYITFTLDLATCVFPGRVCVYFACCMCVRYMFVFTLYSLQLVIIQGVDP